MILLWLICGLMTLAAAVILALPLFDARKLKNDSSFALEVYRDQLAEINRDASRGILDHDQAKAAQVEIERRILALAEAPMFKPARAPSHGLMIALAVVLPLSGFGLICCSARRPCRVRPSPHARPICRRRPRRRSPHWNRASRPSRATARPGLPMAMA